MASDDQPNKNIPPKAWPPKRALLGTNPALPIARPVSAKTSAPTPSPSAEDWNGSEQTLVGVPSSTKEGSDRLPIVVFEDDSSDWTGAEKTTLPASHSASHFATPEDDAIDTVVGPSGFPGDGLGFDAPSDAELNDVWGEAEFEIMDFIVDYQSDQLF